MNAHSRPIGDVNCYPRLDQTLNERKVVERKIGKREPEYRLDFESETDVPEDTEFSGN